MSHYCSPCGVWYPTECAWNLHFPTSDHAPKFSCNSCEYTTYYFNLKSLEQHTKDVHLPPNYCADCDRSFLNDSFLQQHKKLVHVPSIYCSECNRYFKTDAALSQHLRGRAHGSVEMAPRVAASRLYCETCARKFVNKQAMTQHMASLSHNRAARKSSRQSSPAPSTSSTRRPALMERVATAPPSLQAPPVTDSRRSSIASMDDGVSLTAVDDNNLAKPPKETEPAEPTAAAAASASIRSLNLPSTPPPEEFEETVKTPVTVLHIDIPQTPEETQTTTLTPATSVSSRSGDAAEDPFGDKMPDEPAGAGAVRAEVVPVVAEEVELPNAPSTLSVISVLKDTGEKHAEEEGPVAGEEMKDSPTLEFVEAPEEPETVEEPPVVTALEVRPGMGAEDGGVEEQLKEEEMEEQLKEEEIEEQLEEKEIEERLKEEEIEEQLKEKEIEEQLKEEEIEEQLEEKEIEEQLKEEEIGEQLKEEEEEREEEEEEEEEEEPAAAPAVPTEAIPELSAKPEEVHVPSEESIISSIGAHNLPEEKVQSYETAIPERTTAEAIVSEAIIAETLIPEATIAKVDVLPVPILIPETTKEEPVTVTKPVIAEPAVAAVAEQAIATPEPVILEATAPSKLDAIRAPSPSPSNPSTPPPTTPQLNLDLTSFPTPSTTAKEERPRAPRTITQSLISTPAPTSTVESVTASASRSTIICPQCPATSKTLYENTDELTAHIDFAHGKNAKDGKDVKDAGKEKKGLVKGFGRFFSGLRKPKFFG